MKSIRNSVWTILLLLGFSTICNTQLHAAVIVDHFAFEKSGENHSEEALVVTNIPIELLKRELQTALLVDGSPLKKITRLDFDPIDRLMILNGEVEIPPAIMADFEELAGGTKLSERHSFALSISFPSSRLLSTTNFLQLTIHRFELSGQDYSKSFDFLGRFVATLLTNSTIVDYLLDGDETQVINSAESGTSLVKQYIQKKNIRFRENTISFKLNLKEFADFSRFAEIAELRLWQFSPVLLKGTKQTFFRMEAGLGRPHDNWLADSQSRSENDHQTLAEVRNHLYTRYGQTELLSAEFRAQVQSYKVQLDLKNLNARAEQEIHNFLTNLDDKTRRVLSLDNPEFKADPVQAYELHKDRSLEEIIIALSDLKRRVLIERRMGQDADGKQTAPFLTKRLSQRALSQAVRFFREVDYGQGKLFGELDLLLAPHLPGLILKGSVNLDFNDVLALAFEGTGVELGQIPIRADQAQWGSGLPFQAALRVFMLDNGELGLDIKSLSLFTGMQRIVFSADQHNGNRLINFLKMVITQTLLTTLIEQPFASTTVDGVEVNTFQLLLNKIQDQRQEYVRTNRAGGRVDLERIVQLTKLDIETNPFLAVGREFVEGKTELFFKNLIKYDQADELLKLKLDPKIISDTILSSENTIQVWNLEPLYDKKQDQTFLELSLGDGRRGRTYVESLRSRPEYRDSQTFSGTGDRSSDLDVSAVLKLKGFTDLVSHILSEASVQQQKEIEPLLARAEENEFYQIQDLSLIADNNQRLVLNLVLTHIKKSRKGAIRRLFGEEYEVARKSIALDGVIALDTVPLSRYISKIEKHENEVFLADSLVRLDLREVRVKLNGQIGLIDQMINLVGRNLNFDRSSLATKVKVLLLKAVGKYLNPTDSVKNGNVEIAGVKLNRYVKLFTHQEEILLQLHPHILASAFDVKFLTSKEGSSEIGIAVDNKAQTIRFDFETVGNMATVDKEELLAIMLQSKELFGKVLGLNSKDEFVNEMKNLKLFDQAFYNSDKAKPSLRHRFMRILSFYEGLLDASHSDFDLVQQIHRNLGLQQDMTPVELNSRQVTAAGIELSYFLATTLVLKNQIDLLLNKISVMGVEREIPYYGEYVKISKDLRNRFLLPFAEVYQRDFFQRNQRILSRGPTDWNYSYYPDALYSHNLYQELLKVLATEKDQFQKDKR